METFSKEEAEKIDQLDHRLEPAMSGWLWTILSGVILVPLRIAALLSVVVATWIYSTVSMSTESFRKRKENTEFELKVGQLFWRTMFWICGLRVTVKGTPCEAREARMLVAAPHIWCCDAFVAGWASSATSTNFVCPVVTEEIKAVLFAGTFSKMSKAIFVTKDRTVKNRGVVVEKWLESHDSPSCMENDRKVMIFPEGFFSNSEALLPFKTGAFRPGRPVQPALIRYGSGTTILKGIPIAVIALVALFQPVTRVTLEFLPIYYPSEEEKEDARLYARNVQLLMANHLNIPADENASARKPNVKAYTIL